MDGYIFLCAKCWNNQKYDEIIEKKQKLYCYHEYDRIKKEQKINKLYNKNIKSHYNINDNQKNNNKSSN